MKGSRVDIKPATGKHTFPHIGLFRDGTIVLFYKRGSGVVVGEGDSPHGPDRLGGHLPQLNDNYELYSGKVTLEN